jgi:hypothetical protein
MKRSTVTAMFATAAAVGISAAVGLGYMAAGIVRRFGHAPHPHRPGGATVTRLPFESDEMLATRTADEVLRRGREQQ